MRALLILLLCHLPLHVEAQARADSKRHQQLPHNNQRQPKTQQWPQNQARTPLFCQQYARAAAGQSGRVQGSITGRTIGEQGGLAATGNRKQAEGLGIVGATIGSATGASRDKQFFDYHFGECMSGGRLITTGR